MAGTCKRGNKPSGSVKCGEFLDSILKKDSSPWNRQVSIVNEKTKDPEMNCIDAC